MSSREARAPLAQRFIAHGLSVHFLGAIVVIVIVIVVGVGVGGDQRMRLMGPGRTSPS